MAVINRPVIRHSVCRWCYAGVPLETLCREARNLGIESVELLMPEDLAMVRQHGLECAMVSFPTATLPDGTVVGRIEKAFNRVEHHDTLVEIYQIHMQRAADAGARQVICFSGNREGMSDEQGIDHCVIGLKRILPLAEKLGITLVMELLNSKIDHPDYMCDHTEWGVELCRRIDSEHFKLLYDIYHMQTMEGDVIRTIRQHHRHIAHYHTAGVPGRHELHADQELNYPAIMRAIADTGYTGHVGHEFIPTAANPFDSLREAVSLCSLDQEA